MHESMMDKAYNKAALNLDLHLLKIFFYKKKKNIIYNFKKVAIKIQNKEIKNKRK